MANRGPEQVSIAASLLDEITSVEADGMPLDRRLQELACLRESAVESSAQIDRYLLGKIIGLRQALNSVQDRQNELREMIESLSAPPYFPAVFLAAVETPDAQGALVQAGDERRVVGYLSGVADDLAPGDEVLLSHERNCVIARSSTPGFMAGEIATYNRSTSDGRLVLRLRDEEIVVQAKPDLQAAGLKTGDGIRFSRSAGLAFERIESSKGGEYFVESTPSETFLQIGGLEKEIEQLKLEMTLHLFSPEIANRYKLARKRSILLAGPPGNGKTLLARATANWLASCSPSGQSKWIYVKPGALNSVWFGKSEEHYREIFRVARETAAADPGSVTVMFWDEIDAVGQNRGESVNRIDDRLLNSFMAELSDFGSRESGNVVIITATNRIDCLDPALLRPGRLGDLVMHIPPPRAKAARAILARHLPVDTPYATNGHGPAETREILLDQTIAQLFAQTVETELANLTLRDGKRRLVRASDLISGAHLESIAQAALKFAGKREKEGGPQGISSADLNAAICGFVANAPRALSPRNARSYLHDLPQDVDVVRVDLVERNVRNPHQYRLGAA